MASLQADEIFAALDRHAVRYVLIGGLAADAKPEDLLRFLHGASDTAPAPEDAPWGAAHDGRGQHAWS